MYRRICQQLLRTSKKNFYNTNTLSASSFCGRSHTCGELNKSHVGENVTLCGWLQYQRMTGQFLTIRDASGITQVIVPKGKGLSDVVNNISGESVIEICGMVKPRPEGQENKKLSTGDIEVEAKEVKLLSPCRSDMPFHIHDFHKVSESLRLEYRYLDLRNTMMQNNLRLRSKMLLSVRNFLCGKHGFVDVETPTLFRRTPGGAREFIIPTHTAGEYFTLPQSPQQFKQLCMVGSVDRYMQIAKCYRDETAKPDRQPEFTQIDIEMSFVTADDIKSLIEDMLVTCWPTEQSGHIQVPFPRMSYQQAITEYGSDKPDTRFDMKLVDVTDLVSDSSMGQVSDAASVQAINFSQVGAHLSSKEIKLMKQLAKQVDGSVWSGLVKIQEDGSWQGSLAAQIGQHVADSLTDRLNLSPGDFLMLSAGKHVPACCVLGRLRFEIAQILDSKGHFVRDENQMNFIWVEDFPLFLAKEDNSGELESAHHPFTAPHPDDEHLIYQQPEKVRGLHYDLVLNGSEIGGGSIRIHDSKLQKYVLENVLKEDSSELTHLLTALEFGCPPHGGIALGLDRLMSIICKSPSIRDVIAFPKSGDGKDLMANAPAPVSKEDLVYYHITNK